MFFSFDLENTKMFITGAVDKIQVTSKNYTIIDGKILGIPVYGHGKHNMTLGE